MIFIEFLNDVRVVWLSRVVELLLQFHHVRERVWSFSRSSCPTRMGQNYFFIQCPFFVTFLIAIILNFETDHFSDFVFFLIHIFVTRKRIIFYFRIGEGCLKNWYNGVSSATFGSFFPGYQSVTGYCSWLVSCTGWRIIIGRRCKEESESGYRFCFVLFCFDFLAFVDYWKWFCICDSLCFMCLILHWWLSIWPERLPWRVLFSCEYWFVMLCVGKLASCN